MSKTTDYTHSVCARVCVCLCEHVSEREKRSVIEMNKPK